MNQPKKHSELPWKLVDGFTIENDQQKCIGEIYGWEIPDGANEEAKANAELVIRADVVEVLCDAITKASGTKHWSEDEP